MALTDNPIPNMHPAFTALYNDLLNRLGLAQSGLNTLTTNGNTLASSIATQSTDLTKAKNDIAANAADLLKNKNDLVGAATDLTKVKTDITTHTSLLTQHTKDIGNRLRKDAADSTPFTLSVAPAASLTDAVRKVDLVGGLMRPYRNFKNVGASPVGATVRSGQEAAVTALIDGQQWAITGMRLKMITAPGLSTVITIKAGTTTLFTQTLLLAALPAVGKVLDLLNIAATLPADVILPAVITVTASSGTFDLLLDGVLI